MGAVISDRGDTPILEALEPRLLLSGSGGDDGVEALPPGLDEPVQHAPAIATQSETPPAPASAPEANAEGDPIPQPIYVGGVIDSSVSWDFTLAPYILTSSVSIIEGGSLNVSGGVTVSGGQRIYLSGGHLSASGATIGPEMHFYDGSVSLTGCTLTDTLYIETDDPDLTLSGNEFTSNSPAQVYANRVEDLEGNSFTYDGRARIKISDGSLTESGSWGVMGSVDLYTMNYPSTLTISEDATLTLEPGITISGDRIYVGNAGGEGHLSASGATIGPEVHFINGSVSLTGCTLTDTLHAETDDPDLTLTGNDFTFLVPADLWAHHVPNLAGNSFTYDGVVTAWISDDSSLVSDAAWNVIDGLAYYRIYDPRGYTPQLHIREGATLTFGSGTTVSGGEIHVGRVGSFASEGHLSASGATIGPEVHFINGSVSLTGCTLTDTLHAETDDPDLTLTGNDFTFSVPANMSAFLVPELRGNSFSGTGTVTALVNKDWGLTTDVVWSAVGSLAHYSIYDPRGNWDGLNIYDGATLTIESGVTVSGDEIYVGGHLAASNATINTRIRFQHGSAVIWGSTLNSHLDVWADASISIGHCDLSVAHVSAWGDPLRTISLRNNWWGTTDPVAIEAKVYHHADDISRPWVDYTPFLSGPPIIANEEFLDSSPLGTMPGSPIRVTGAIEGGEFDLYRFSVSRRSLVSADIDAAELGSSLDSYLRLFGESGTDMGYSDDDPGPGETWTLDSYIERELAPGTYYLGVSGWANMRYSPFDSESGVPGSEGPYDLILSSSGTAAPPEHYAEVGGLDLAGDFTVGADGTHTATGTIIINDLLRVEGWVSYDSSLNVWGDGQVWLDDVPVLGDVMLMDGEFRFPGGEVITDELNGLLSGLEVVGLSLYLDGFRLLDNGVRIEGALALPDELGGVKVDFSDPHFIDLTTDGIVYDFVVTTNDLDIDLSGIKLYARDVQLAVSNADGTADAILTGTFGMDGLFDGVEVNLSEAQGNYFRFGEDGWAINGTLEIGRIDFIPHVLYARDLFLDVDTDTWSFYAEGTVHLPLGLGVDVTGRFGIVQGYLDTVGLSVSDLDVVIWPAPPVLLDKIGATVSRMTPDEIDHKPAKIELEAGLQLGPDFGSHNLLYLDVDGWLDLGGGVGGSVALLVGNPGDPIAGGSMAISWLPYEDEFSLEGRVFVGDSGDPIFDLSGFLRMRGDTTRGGLAGTVYGTHIPGWVRSTLSFLGIDIPDEVAAKAYVQIIDDEDDDNDFIIAGNEDLLTVKVHLRDDFSWLRDIDWLAEYEELDTYVPTAPIAMASASPTADDSHVYDLPAGLDAAIFQATWETGDTDLNLTDPGSGVTYTPANVDSYPDVAYFKDAGDKAAVFVVNRPAGGQWRVTVTETDGIGAYDVSARKSTTAPAISVLQPQYDTAAGTVDITWTDEDSDSYASIDLYYDTDREGADGVLIVGGISEDDAADSYAWDTTGVATGGYYVYAVIDDGTNVPAISYSTGRVSVVDPDAPGQVTGLAAPEGTDTTVRLTWDTSAAADLDHYRIRLTDDAAGEFYQQVVSPGDATEFILDGLTAGETYRVSVAAVDTDGHVGIDSDPIVAIPGGTAGVAPEAGQWEVFAQPGTLYQAQAPGDAGDTFDLVAVPTGATVDASGLFEWNVPAGADGWYEVLMHVTDTDGVTEVFRYNLLADGTIPAFAPGTVQVNAGDDVTLQITAPDGVDASGVVLYQLERDGGVVGEWRTSPVFEDTGLGPNTSYDYRVQIKDSSPDGHTLWSAVASGRTFAAVPGEPVFGEADQTTVVLASLASDANPVGTEYAIYNATADNYVAADGTPGASAVWQTFAAWKSTTITGLEMDTRYSFQALGRNADGIETVLGPESTARTARESDAPTVQTAGYSIDTRSVEIAFSESVAISKKDLELEDGDGLPVDLAGAVFSHVPGGSTASLGVAGLLSDGHYALVVSGQSVQDLAGNLLDGDDNGTPGGDYAAPFSVLLGDTDGNLIVDAGDYGTLMGQFGLRGDGLAADFNGDGRVNLTDFAIMRGNFGNTLPPAAPAAALQAAVEPIAAAGAPAAGGEAGLDVLAVVAAVTSVNPGTASDQSTVISDQLTANDNGVAPRHVKAVPGHRTPNNDVAAAIDMLAELPSAAGYISGPQPISVGSTATTLYREATGEYDLRPLSDDPATGDEGDPLADILAESRLAVPL